MTLCCDVKDHEMKAAKQIQKRSKYAFSAILMVCLCLVALTQSGCLNSLVMAGKVLMGDPQQPSGFELVTGISLKEEQKRVLIHCSAPSYLSDDYDTLTSDVQEELIRRMRRRGLAVMHPDAAADVLDDFAGHFDPNLIASKLDDVDYIFHIQFDKFSYREDNSPNLYRGRASGIIVGHEVRGGKSGRHSVKVYDQGFSTTHPSAHPITVDQMPKTVFIRRFIDRIADDLGNTFYNVQSSSLFVQ